MTDASRLLVVALDDAGQVGMCAFLLAGIGGSVLSLVGDAPGTWTTDPGASVPYRLDGESVFEDRLEGTPATAGRLSLDEVRDLAARADVVLSSRDMATLARLGLDGDALRRTSSSVIVGVCPAVATPVGVELPGGDLQALALSGVLSLVGEPTDPPLPLAGRQGRYSGGLGLFTGVLFALYRRTATGTGSDIVTSSTRCLAYEDFKSVSYAVADGVVQERGSDIGPLIVRCRDGSIAFYYRASDWPNVKRLLPDPRLDDVRFQSQRDRDRHRAALADVLEAVCATWTRAELYHAAQRIGLPFGSVVSLDELVDDPQYVARGTLAQRNGHLVPGIPWTINGERPDASITSGHASRWSERLAPALLVEGRTR